MSTLSVTAQPSIANRKALLLTLAVFIFPVAIAYTLLKTGWYVSAGTSNRGILIKPPIVFDDLNLFSQQNQPLSPQQFRNKWWIVFVMPAQCDTACKNSLYLMRQSHLALGPDQERVAELIIHTQSPSVELQQWLAQEFPNVHDANADATQLDTVLAAVQKNQFKASVAGHLYLMDTMGAIFMHYPTFTDEHESILKGRDLLKDLQRVLKLSKIG